MEWQGRFESWNVRSTSLYIKHLRGPEWHYAHNLGVTGRQRGFSGKAWGILCLGMAWSLPWSVLSWCQTAQFQELPCAWEKVVGRNSENRRWLTFLKKKKNWSYEKKLGKFCILGTLSRAWSLMDKKFWVLKKFISIFNVLLLSSFDFYNPMSLRRMNPCCSICK